MPTWTDHHSRVMSRAFLRRPDRSELFNSIPRVQESDTWSDKDKDEKYFFNIFYFTNDFYKWTTCTECELELERDDTSCRYEERPPPPPPHQGVEQPRPHNGNASPASLPFPPSVRGFILFISLRDGEEHGHNGNNALARPLNVRGSTVLFWLLFLIYKSLTTTTTRTYLIFNFRLPVNNSVNRDLKGVLIFFLFLNLISTLIWLYWQSTVLEGILCYTFKPLKWRGLKGWRIRWVACHGAPLSFSKIQFAKLYFRRVLVVG